MNYPTGASPDKRRGRFITPCSTVITAGNFVDPVICCLLGQSIRPKRLAFKRFPIQNMLIEKSGECHNHKPKQNADPSLREKWHVQNKQTHARDAHRSAPSSPSEVITMLKRMKKHEDKEHRKTLKHEAPRSKPQLEPHRIRTTP